MCTQLQVFKMIKLVYFLLVYLSAYEFVSFQKQFIDE